MNGNDDIDDDQQDNFCRSYLGPFLYFKTKKAFFQQNTDKIWPVAKILNCGAL